jgi:hypothetical protein
MKIEIMEFENLRELLKPLTAAYILKYVLEEDKAIYYMLSDGPNFVYFAFCIDKNYKDEHIKISGSDICSTAEPTATTIMTSTVAYDSLLEKILGSIFPEEEEKEEKKK